MSLVAHVNPGYVFAEGDTVTADRLNALGLPTVEMEGAVEAGDIEEGAITFVNLSPDLILGAPTVITTLEGLDRFLVGDASASANAAITVTNAWSSLQTQGVVATSFNDYALDTITWFRANTAAAQKTTLAYFAESLINQAPEMLDATADADGVLITDASAAPGSKAKIVGLGSLLPPVITPGTYNGITGATVRADGRVTAFNTSASFLTTLGTAAIPAAGFAASISHGLSAIPSIFQVRLRCLEADRGYDPDTEVPLEYFTRGNADTTTPFLTPSATTSAIVVRRDPASFAGDIYVTGGDGTTWSTVAIDTAKWLIVARGVR